MCPGAHETRDRAERDASRGDAQSAVFSALAVIKN
jgi:hypothetical protein